MFRQALSHFWPGAEGYPVKLIQVAGTSGKGSTCQFLRTGLALYGKSGCYVKPHVFDYAERFVIGDSQVGHAEILSVWEEVKPYCVESSLKGDAWQLSHPEVSLLIALKLFERHRLEWAAVETGVGGRYDPVTCLRVAATVFTNVGRDHENVLGSEHWQRALEKAGICRAGVPLVLGDEDARTKEVVRAVCSDVGTPLHLVTERSVQALEEVAQEVGHPDDEAPLLGSGHQLRNAAVAAETIKVLVGKADLKRLAGRFMGTRYVGRFWKVGDGVYADVAHNPSKTEALAEEIDQRFPGAKKVFVVGISGARDPVEVVGPLVPQAKALVVTAAGYKGQDPEAVYTMLRERYPTLPIHLAAAPRATLNVAKNLRSKGEVIVFTGSTYMIDQALNPDDRLRHLNGTYGWRESGVAQQDLPE